MPETFLCYNLKSDFNIFLLKKKQSLVLDELNRVEASRPIVEDNAWATGFPFLESHCTDPSLNQP